MLKPKNECNKNASNYPLFKPKINKISEELIKEKGCFEQRLQTYLEEKNYKLNVKARSKR